MPFKVQYSSASVGLELYHKGIHKGKKSKKIFVIRLACYYSDLKQIKILHTDQTTSTRLDQRTLTVGKGRLYSWPPV